MGTSGWSYREWVGAFYPPGTAASKMLAVYASELPTVEAHATYRRHPSAATLDRWAADVPPGFTFAPKAHAAITHQRDTEGLPERVARFCAAVGQLGPHLGPVLFQLPHRAPDLDRLDLILDALPPGVTAAFELGPQWLGDDVLNRLARAGATLVLTDADDRPAPDVEVGPVAYVRLRRHDYTPADLDGWAARLARLAAGGRDVHAYLRHDESGRAPVHARRLMEAVTA